MSIKEEDYKILWHSLGINVEKRIPYRNYFIAGEGHHDMPSIERLIKGHYMIKQPANIKLLGEDCFAVTEAGRDAAIRALPLPSKMTRSQRRYEAYLKSETDESFGEWLKNPYWDDYRKREQV